MVSGLCAVQLAVAADAPSGGMKLAISNQVKTVTWPLVPALETNRLLSGSTLTNLSPVAGSTVLITPGGYTYSISNELPAQFFAAQLWQKSSNALLAANALNRLAYGPTPDELERIASMGPQSWIDEQLAMTGLNEPMDYTPPSYFQTTNTAAPEAWVRTNWVQIMTSGTFSSSNLYVYLTVPGDGYLDDIALYAGTGTNISYATNYVINGDFELPLSNAWKVTSGFANSAISTDFVHGGAGSLHIVSTTNGTTKETSIWQSMAPGLTNNQRCTLSYWYLPRTNANILTLRLSGSGIVSSPPNEPAYSSPTWVYATFTGPATSSNLYTYLDSGGVAYLDDLRLVAGTNAAVGPNLLRGGDFESSFPAPDWWLAPNCTNSAVTPLFAHSGNSSLRLNFSSGGSTVSSAIVQSNIPLTLNSTCTLSYWYVPSSRGRLTVRLSGSGISSTPDGGTAGAYRRLQTLSEGSTLSDLRAWFCRHAVEANRQLLEVLDQFWENHFVTYHSKSVDYLDQYYDDFDLMDRLAANMEFRENNRWRNALLDPACTFHDLLKISAESPAQIIYLDTVNSRGDGNNIANENYARELFELYSMGVDNGYEQSDIVAMSRAWTGWRVRLVDAANEFNPFASQSTTVRVADGNTSISNLVGLWSFVFDAARHGTNRAPILSQWDPNSPATNPVALGPKLVPPRFGPRWAGQSYQLPLPRRATGDTNGIQDGYDVIRHLANVPMTMEYISVKLCRVFVHDGFPNPTTRTALPEYDFYDYRRPDLSPEAKLVYDCMVAWDSGSPKGQIREVLQTIFNSELFRSHGGSLQKVKTPLEFVASTVRALRSVNADGTATVTADGYSFPGALSRMGQMSLFNRSDPDGYPEAGPPWVSAGTLAERLKFVQSFCIASGSTGHTGTYNDAGGNVSDPVALLKKKLPSGLWNNDGAVVDYFLSILFPGEGAANLALFRQSAVQFLNLADDGLATSLFSGLSNTGTPYNNRVRGLVAFLMTTQRFQEQ
jgi:uncharacterized protein (DUF1800 family)